MIYDLFLSKDYFLFSCAHFVIGEKFFEPLHGHNYKLQVNIFGIQGKDNMVIDFHVIKKVVKPIIDRIDHHMIVPIHNPFIFITENPDEQLIITIPRLNLEYELPKSDVLLLPIENTTVEELSHYFINLLTDCDEFKRENIERVTVSVLEYEGQGVTFELFPCYNARNNGFNYLNPQ